ncbi:MAG: AAA family ATPase [Nocardioidaceae bacterium]
MTVAALLAAGDAPWESALVQGAQETHGVTLVRRCVDVTDAVATAASGQVRVALLSMDLPGLDTDAVLRISEAGVHPVGIVSGVSGEDARAVALGMRAVIGPDGLAGLAGVVDDLDRRQPGDTGDVADADAETGAVPARPTARGQVLAVWGPTGAPGRSTVALGIASETAALGVPTLLVDADVYGGSIAQMLAVLDEVSGLLAACRSADTGRLTADGLQEHVRRLGPMLGLLTGLPRADRWTGLRHASFAAVLEVARELAAVVVLDLGFCLETAESLSFDTAAPRRNGVTLHGLESADTVAVVGSADPLGLTRLTRAVFDLRDSVPSARPQLVVNKVRNGLGWREDEIAATVQRFSGLAPARMLPLDQAATDAAWTSGRTLLECARESPLRAELSTLAKQLTVADFPVSGQGRRRRRRRR